eukprot:6206747-Pleurochrysis_carterae.AAC.11
MGIDFKSHECQGDIRRSAVSMELLRPPVADSTVTAPVSSGKHAPQRPATHKSREHHTFAVSALARLVASFRGVAWSLC